MERCDSCQYYDRNQRNGDAKAGNAGQCRKSAPMLSPLNQKTYMIEGVWPTVRDDDWCGEWKALVRRLDPSRRADVLGAALPVTAVSPAMPSMPASPSSGGGLALPPTPPRVSVQAAGAALATLGIESRSAAASPLASLTGGGPGDD